MQETVRLVIPAKAESTMEDVGMNRSQPHSIPREGLIAGAIGATSVAVWFLILDTIQGRPFHTPTVLGGALFSILGPPMTESNLFLVAGYTVFHYAVFGALG